MLERTLVFVDTSYLLASFYNSWETGARAQLEIDLPEVVATLDNLIRNHLGNTVHRQNWYDGIPDSGPHRYQRALRTCNGVQLRTGQLIELGERRTQKGVDTRLVADMVVAAMNQQVTDFILVSGDADMIPGVEEATRNGIRVHLYGFGWDSMSAALRQACDTMTILDPREDFADAMMLQVLEGPLPPMIRGQLDSEASETDASHPDSASESTASAEAADGTAADSADGTAKPEDGAATSLPEAAATPAGKIAADDAAETTSTTHGAAAAADRSSARYPVGSREEKAPADKTSADKTPADSAQADTSQPNPAQAEPTEDATATDAEATVIAPVPGPLPGPLAQDPDVNSVATVPPRDECDEPSEVEAALCAEPRTANNAVAEVAKKAVNPETPRAEAPAEATTPAPAPKPRPTPSMMAPRRKLRSRYVPLPEEVWTTRGFQTPFEVGQQYASWWFDNAADAEQRDQAHMLSGGGLPPEIDRPLLQFACETLHEYTLSESQRIKLRDGFHSGIRGVLINIQRRSES